MKRPYLKLIQIGTDSCRIVSIKHWPRDFSNNITELGEVSKLEKVEIGLLLYIQSNNSGLGNTMIKLTH